MFRSSFVAPFAVCAGFGTISIAAPATEEGAQALVGVFESYLSATPGVVSVSPEGETYKVVLDAAPLVAKAAGDATFRMTPIEFLLADRGDGTWDVTQNQAFDLSASVPDAADVSLTMASVAMTGVWDESIQGFSTYEGSATGIGYVTTTFEGEAKVPARQLQSIDEVTFSGTGVANAAGGVDVEQNYEAKRLKQTMPIPSSDGTGSASDITITVASYSGTTEATAMRAAEMLDLLAWFVRHPSEAEIVSAQGELKTALTAVLPVFDHLNGTVDMTDISAETPVGPVALDRAAIVIEARGAVPDGLLREAFHFEGLSLPTGVVPDWAVQLVPKSASIDVTGSGFDLAAVAKRAIEAFDLTKTPPMEPAVSDELAALILPKGTVRIDLAPGDVTGPAYSLLWEGQMDVGPGQSIPVGKAKVTAKGLDAVREALKSAPPDMGGPASMGIGAAVAVGKIESDGTVVWEIDATTPGELRINGRLMPTGMP